MAENVISTIIKLRRDNDYNYEKVKDTFIPAKGEPILVDTARDGLRVKIGDGIKTYNQLEFSDSLFITGYLHDGVFYKDSQYSEILNGSINRLYINSTDGKVHYYNGSNYLQVSGTTAAATSTTAGVMFLYDTTGQNTDGTMTQKAITDELNEKFEVDIDTSEEMIIFSTNL